MNAHDVAIPLAGIATSENFNEAGYLDANPDVAVAVRDGTCRSGRHHFEAFGRKERRPIRFANSFADAQRRKLERIEPLLDRALPHARRGAKYDFLTAEMRAETGIAETIAVSAHGYDPRALQLIEELADGLILDCGAGRRDTYYRNVVNYEIVDYDTTDVIGAGEKLPFRDEAFDGVISIAVLEHVRDPFACAAEIVRVLKPGGKLICCVPFLQPMHGFPHHYYNMTAQGLRALFDRRLQIDGQIVPDSTLPVFSLSWMAQSWARALDGAARREFLSLRMQDLLAHPTELAQRRWVTELPPETNLELASATMLFAHKPA